MIIRFIDIGFELYCFEKYFDTIEKHLPLVEMMEWRRIDVRRQKKELRGKPFDAEGEAQELIGLTNHVLPRFFRNPLVLSLWAIYESAIIQIASYLREKKDKKLKIDDVRGNFLNKARKYFNHILEFPLCPDNRAWEHIKNLYLLRNAIAHANGRLERVEEKSRNKIIKLEQAGIGISIDLGCILISERLLRETYEVVKRSLDELIDRAVTEHTPTSQ